MRKIENVIIRFNKEFDKKSKYTNIAYTKELVEKILPDQKIVQLFTNIQEIEYSIVLGKVLKYKFIEENDKEIKYAVDIEVLNSVYEKLLIKNYELRFASLKENTANTYKKSIGLYFIDIDMHDTYEKCVKEQPDLKIDSDKFDYLIKFFIPN